jgi:hypothetical protein
MAPPETPIGSTAPQSNLTLADFLTNQMFPNSIIHRTVLFATQNRLSVCTENVVRIDLEEGSLNVGDDGRAVILLADAAGLAVQVEKPT